MTAAAMAMFLAISAGILIGLATGNDPALANGTTVSRVASKLSTTTTSSTTSASSHPTAVTTSAS